jgi:hypothetical protein
MMRLLLLKPAAAQNSNIAERPRLLGDVKRTEPG